MFIGFGCILLRNFLPERTGNLHSILCTDALLKANQLQDNYNQYFMNSLHNKTMPVLILKPV